MHGEGKGERQRERGKWMKMGSAIGRCVESVREVQTT